MNRLIYPLVMLLTEWMKPRYDAQLRFLEYQIQMIRSRIDTDRIVPSAEERVELLRLGALFGHDTCDLVHVVVPETYRTWLRKAREEQPAKRSGRPRIPQALRNLVLRIASENELWGYRRICGELKKIGVFIGDTTVRKILVDEGLQPPPRPHSSYPIPWQVFLAAHYESLVACDFFSKKI